MIMIMIRHGVLIIKALYRSKTNHIIDVWEAIKGIRFLALIIPVYIFIMTSTSGYTMI